MADLTPRTHPPPDWSQEPYYPGPLPWTEHKQNCDECCEAWAFALVLTLTDWQTSVDRATDRMIQRCCPVGPKLYFQESQRAREY